MLGRFSFTTIFYAVVGALLLLIGVLFIATHVAGPRVRYATLDPFPGGSRLTLRFNQQVQAPQTKDVTLSPAASFTVAGNGNSMYVQFSQPLRYDTAYTLSFAVDGKQMRRTFHTEPATAYYNYQHLTQQDEIRRRPLDGNKDEVLYAADTIIDFGLMQSGLIVTTLRPDSTHNLIYIDLASGKKTTVPLPDTGTISALRVSPDRTSFGFVLAGNTFTTVSTRLFMGRADTPGDEPKEVSGIGGSDLSAREWRYAPDGTTLLIQTSDSSVLLVDTALGVVTPLGQFATINGFTADGKSILVTDDALVPSLLNLSSLDLSPLPLSRPVADTRPTAARPLYTRAGALTIGNKMAGTVYRQYVYVDTGKQARELYSVANPENIIVEAATSSNDYYGIIETTGTFSEGTGQRRSYLINLATGDEVAMLPGAHAQVE